MGSPLGSIFANIFFSYHEQNWLKHCHCEFKPVICKRYVDDTFLLFRSKDHSEKFRCYLDCQYPNTKFISEIEENNSLSFLNNKINGFSTNIFRKVTFCGVFTNFKSCVLVTFKLNLKFTLLLRTFKLCSNFDFFSSKDT